MTDIKMPSTKGNLAEAKITEWCKHVGDPVRTGDILFRAATDPNSAPTDVASQSNGTLKSIAVPQGQSAKPGETVAVLS